MKHLSFSLAVRILAVAILAFVLTRELVAIHQIGSAAASTAAEAAERTGTDDRTQELRALRSTSAEDVARIDQATVTKSRLAGVITGLEDAGRSLGLSVTISSVNAANASGQSGVTTARISIETTGPWANSFAYLHLLESLPYKSLVEDSRLAFTDKGWHGTYGISFTLVPE